VTPRPPISFASARVKCSRGAFEHTEEGGLRVDHETLVEIVLCDLDKRLFHHFADGVHDDVQLAEPTVDGIEQLGDIAHTREVSANEESVTTEAPDLGSGLLGLAVRMLAVMMDRYATAAVSCQHYSIGSPLVARSACHQCYFSFEIFTDISRRHSFLSPDRRKTSLRVRAWLSGNPRS
jgi:hypothetical protein